MPFPGKRETVATTLFQISPHFKNISSIFSSLAQFERQPGKALPAHFETHSHFNAFAFQRKKKRLALTLATHHKFQITQPKKKNEIHSTLTSRMDRPYP
jgi:hypothetical protein